MLRRTFAVRSAPAAGGAPPVLPEWAVKRETLLSRGLDNFSEYLQSSAMRIIGLGDKLMSLHPKESLYRIPRLLKVAGKRPVVMDNTFIAPSALLTGDVRVGRKNYIGYNAIIRAEKGETIYLGESCNVQEKAVVTGNTTVGKWATIEPMAIVESADIASGSFVGASAIVMRGARMESGSMLCTASVLQAGAVIPSNEIWAGNPAEKIGELTEEEKNEIVKAAKHMVLLSIEHRDSWELTWEQLEDQREAREQFARYAENNREIRVKAFYVKEPPRPNRKAMSRRTPQEMVDGGEHKPPFFESVHQGY